MAQSPELCCKRIGRMLGKKRKSVVGTGAAAQYLYRHISRAKKRRRRKFEIVEKKYLKIAVSLFARFFSKGGEDLLRREVRDEAGRPRRVSQFA